MPTPTEPTHQPNVETNLGGQSAPATVGAPAATARPDEESAMPVNGDHLPRNGHVTKPPAPAPAPVATPEQPSLPISVEQLARTAVRIRGRHGGVALEIGEGDWAPLLELLRERLTAADGFFRGGRVMLDVGVRSLHDAQIQQVGEILAEHEMHLTVVSSTAEPTLQAAAALGLSTAGDLEESEPLPAPTSAAKPSAPPVRVPPLAPSPTLLPEGEAAATPARPQHFVHRGSLRSGQVLRKTESIVIIGDVNPGAQVISSGDIMVWGRLRGVAFAGADGNRKAVVAALDFVPTQLRIAHLTTIPPAQKRRRWSFFWRKPAGRRPEIARILDGKIIVEPWDETRSYGPSALRR